MQKDIFILSLGGSLIVPNQVDHDFLGQFIDLIRKKTGEGKKFVIICGGGGINKLYNNAAVKVRAMTNDELDWIGIYATRYNAEFVRLLFADLAHNEIATNPHKKFKTEKPVIVGAGYIPGWSSDYDAVHLAKTYSAKTVINLSNIDYAYDKDPKAFPDAKPIEKISWSDFRKIVGDEWQPRMNTPFDPIASREAEKLKLRVIVLNGKNVSNLEDLIDGKDFRGTTIS